jgi:nitrite reductase (NADH) small subunit
VSMEPWPFVRLAAVSDIEEGKMVGFEYQGRKVLLARKNGVIYAMRNICAHRAVLLTLRGMSKLEGYTVRCWAHNYTFDLRTGQGIFDPELKIPVYEVKIEGEDVLVSLPPLPATARL